MTFLRSTLIRIAIIPALAACVCSSTPAAAQETPLPTAVSRTDEIEHWVSQLDDDHYDQRQRAQLNLQQAGKPALEAVVKAAESGTLESVTRAVNVLLQWSEAEDLSFRREVLQAMANLPNRPREAAMASRVLANLREQEARSKLLQLGAKLEPARRVPGISNLRVVLDKEWKGQTADLKLLVDIPRAATISVQSAEVDDSIFEEVAKLPGVQRIELYKTKTTLEAVRAFKKEHPERDVDFRRGAMLGVNGLELGQSVVTKVEDGSAAAKAGIKAGDNITAINGQPVESFKVLTEKIGEYHAGQSAKLTIERGEDTLELEVTFGDMAGSKMMRPQAAGGAQLTPNQIRILQQNRRVVPQQIPIQVAPRR